MDGSRKIRVTAQIPGTEEARLALARRVASVHAGMVRAQLEGMDCPLWQKDALLRQLTRGTENSGKTFAHG